MENYNARNARERCRMASWQETLRLEWASTRDCAMREYLLAIYADKLAALPGREREKLFQELADLTANCGSAHCS